ncbi:MAG: ATP-binding protein [Salinispira sp.]
MSFKMTGTSGKLSKLISLIMFYIILIVLIIFFANQILLSRISDNDLYIVLFWIAAIIIPGSLLLGIVINLLRLFREQRAKASGAVFKTRLINYFLILVILSVAPQALLSLSFIRVIGDTWFNDRVGQGLQSSLNITADIQQSLAANVRSFMYTSSFTNFIEQSQGNFEELFSEIREIRPSISAVQVFSSAGDILYMGGNEDARVDYADILRSPEGFVVRDIRQDRSFIRIRRTIGDNTFVLMEELPRGFGETILQIQESLTLFTEYKEIKDILYTGLIIFYGIFSLPLFFLAILAGFYLSDTLIQPIEYLENAIRKVAAGNFSFRILTHSRADLGHLVESFNLMLAELERSRNQLVQSERIAAWKDIAQRLAHEIKNPITPIRLSIERLERKYEQKAEDFPQVLNTSVKSIVREVDHLSLLITEFRKFARLPLLQQKDMSLLRIIKDILDMPTQVNVVIENITEETIVRVDPDQFHQVFRNLLSNSLDAIKERSNQEGKDIAGEIHFNTQVITIAGKDFRRIQVQDNGIGMDEQQISHIFDPHYTGKTHGTGLGLVIVQRIIQDHNGKISVESEYGKGTRFFIDIPISEGRA